ncbi:ATP-binding protein [Granulosicoccus antarcticus]|uniref:histidine kinase n=1 Tax=Granulosicoccus antarcticus IMCC3135 TaxID=1192854 RepID=A0A2Z2NK73_9GAMM|nr:ATP-binding protein [Granulosicoccus antarcticus]ASJ71579.1 Blue-light-activated protein [Granulosicoccus antarcticus IMCC3135]
MNLKRGAWRTLDSGLLIAAAILATGAIVMLFGLNKELASSQNIFNDDLPSYAVRAEFDLAVLISSLNEFALGYSSPEEMQIRYDVLLSRYTHYESAFLTEFTLADVRFHQLLEAQKVKLLSLEEAFFALQTGDTANAMAIRDQFKEMHSPLSQLSNITRQHQFSKYLQIDESLAHSLRVGTLMLASTLILCALALGRFWYSLREKTRFSEELEAKIRIRTLDLQNSNNELKREIAERQRAEKSLAERDQQMHRVQKMEAVGRITAGVAHDFNNLLAVIMGNIELLMSSDRAPKASKYLDNALSATIMGSQLTRKLLAFGRRSPLKPEVVNLNRIVTDLEGLFLQTISEKNTLQLHLSNDLRSVSVDRSLLENVLLNLLINARDALQGGGFISIETDNFYQENDLSVEDDRLLLSGHYVRISITDSGTGMSEEVLEQAIEPFFTTKPESKGSGLGLSMAYGFVQQSNGSIQIRSKLGMGTSVRLIFPVSSDGEAIDITYRPVVHVSFGSTRRILVAEDSDAVRNTVVSQLQLLGYETIEASSGYGAYQLIKSDISIDLLLTDVVMPGSLQGPELAKLVLKLNPDLKIVFMSGYPKGMENQADCANDELTKLMKPISLATLSQTLRSEFETSP